MLAGSEKKGVIANSLKNLQGMLLQKEQVLYIVSENSDQIKALTYQIDIQKKLIIESLASVKASMANRVIEIDKQIQIYNNQNKEIITYS